MPLDMDFDDNPRISARKNRDRARNFTEEMSMGPNNLLEFRGDAKQIAALNMLTTHRVIAHRHLREKKLRPVFDDVKIEVRNFAIGLLQKLEPMLEEVKARFLSNSRPLNLREFKELILDGLNQAENSPRLPFNPKTLETSQVYKETEPNPWYFAQRGNTDMSLEVLFKAIDHQAAGRVKWEDFIAFCIDSTMRGRVGVDYDSFVMSYEPCFAQEGHAFQGVKRIKPLPDLGRVLMAEKKQVKLAESTAWQPIRQSQPDGGTLLDVEHIPDIGMTAASSSDMSVRLFDFENPKALFAAKADVSQVVLRWSSKWKRLFSASRSGHVNVWNVQQKAGSVRGTTPTLLSTFQPHATAVTEMLIHPLDGSVITSSLDCSITLMEPAGGTIVQRFRGHEAAVLSIGYSSSYNLLISAGLERDPFIWILSGSTSDRPFLLHDADKPHRDPVCSVVALPGTPRMASLDVKGMMKIWDIRSFACITTIHCNTHSPASRPGHAETFSALAYLQAEQQLVACSDSRLCIYEHAYSVTGVQAPADKLPISRVLYCQRQKVFLTIAGQNVRIWNAITGELQTMYDNIVQDEITAFCPDGDETKFFIGDHAGRVSSYTLMNGILIRDYGAVHEDEICGLVYLPDKKLCLSCSWDGAMIMIPDTPDKHVPPISLMKGPADLRCIDYSITTTLAAVGNAKNIVSVWQVGYGVKDPKAVSIIKLSDAAMKVGRVPSSTLDIGVDDPESCEVQCIRCLADCCGFVASDSNGMIYIYNVAPAPYAYSLLCAWKNQAPDDATPKQVLKYKQLSAAVGAMGFCAETGELYIGDEYGYLHVYDLSAILAQGYCDPIDEKRMPPPPNPSANAVLVQRLRTWKAHEDSIRVIEVPASGALGVIVTGGYDNRVCIYNPKNGTLVGNLDQNGFSFDAYSLKVTGKSDVDMTARAVDSDVGRFKLGEIVKEAKGKKDASQRQAWRKATVISKIVSKLRPTRTALPSKVENASFTSHASTDMSDAEDPSVLGSFLGVRTQSSLIVKPIQAQETRLRAGLVPTQSMASALAVCTRPVVVKEKPKLSKAQMQSIDEDVILPGDVILEVPTSPTQQAVSPTTPITNPHTIIADIGIKVAPNTPETGLRDDPKSGNTRSQHSYRTHQTMEEFLMSFNNPRTETPKEEPSRSGEQPSLRLLPSIKEEPLPPAMEALIPSLMGGSSNAPNQELLEIAATPTLPSDPVEKARRREAKKERSAAETAARAKLKKSLPPEKPRKPNKSQMAIQAKLLKGQEMQFQPNSGLSRSRSQGPERWNNESPSLGRARSQAILRSHRKGLPEVKDSTLSPMALLKAGAQGPTGFTFGKNIDKFIRPGFTPGWSREFDAVGRSDASSRAPPTISQQDMPPHIASPMRRATTDKKMADDCLVVTADNTQRWDWAKQLSAQHGLHHGLAVNVTMPNHDHEYSSGSTSRAHSLASLSRVSTPQYNMAQRMSSK